MKINDIWKEIDMRLKILLTIFAFISTLTGFGFTVYSTFAKEKEFRQLVAMIEFDKEKERKKELRQIIFECKTRYGENYEKADDLARQICRDAEIELETYREEVKK